MSAQHETSVRLISCRTPEMETVTVFAKLSVQMHGGSTLLASSSNALSGNPQWSTWLVRTVTVNVVQFSSLHTVALNVEIEHGSACLRACCASSKKRATFKHFTAPAAGTRRALFRLT